MRWVIAGRPSSPPKSKTRSFPLVPRPVRGTKGNDLVFDFGGDEGRPAMTHLMTDLRHCQVIAGHLTTAGAVHVDSFGRMLLHLVGSGVDRLNELPLESSGAAIILQAPLGGPNAGDGAARGAAAQRAVAGSAGFLVIDAEIGIVGQKIELVAQVLDDRAGHIPRIGQSVVMEVFIDDGEWTVRLLDRGQVDFGAVDAR